MTKPIIIALSILFMQCQRKHTDSIETAKAKELRQDALIEKYVNNCAKKFSYSFQMQEWQNCLDEGLKEDSTVAYFWQQKAMPYFKARKYEVGMTYLDKAVFYKPERWLSYRAFIKCIFAKTYKEAIIDFELCLKRDGNTYVQDHTYQFYIALSYLQLNEFEKAEAIFKKDIEAQEEEWEEAHHTDLFYYGISKYEQGKWEDAIVEFDKSLQQYNQFFDAKFYKALCLIRLNKMEESRPLMEEAKYDKDSGYSINEANSIYETYPYQITW